MLLGLTLKDSEVILTDLVERRIIRPAERRELVEVTTEGYAFLLVNEARIPYGDWEAVPEELLGLPPDRFSV